MCFTDIRTTFQIERGKLAHERGSGRAALSSALFALAFRSNPNIINFFTSENSSLIINVLILYEVVTWWALNDGKTRKKLFQFYRFLFCFVPQKPYSCIRGYVKNILVDIFGKF